MNYKEHLNSLVIRNNLFANENSKSSLSEIFEDPNKKSVRVLEFKTNCFSCQEYWHKEDVNEDEFYKRLYLSLMKRFFEMVSDKETCESFHKSIMEKFGKND